jgi:hypothetical protein
MYNFRYHLVSICAIFVSLAIGLLLGAAIAGSDLARSASDNMVDSMLVHFDELNETNRQLEQLANDNANLLDAYVNVWAKDRLDGRTVAVVLGNRTSDATLATALTTNLARGNAATVNIKVNLAQLGLQNLQIRQALQTVLPAVADEDYETTLAKRLAQEWSYSYTLVETNAPGAADARPSDADYHATASQELQAQPSTTLSPEHLNIDGGPAPQTAFQTAFYERYVVTRALLSLGVISIETNYALLAQHANPQIASEQAAALALATAWKLPYGVNGLVDALVDTTLGGANSSIFGSITGGTVDATTDATMSANALGVALVTSFNELGSAGALPYPAWLAPFIPNAQNATFQGAAAQSNYYALFVQSDKQDGALAAVAAAHGLSCVTAPDTATGRYAVLALLSGAQAGTYGDDRPVNSRFPALPADSTGRAPFVQG